MHFEVKIRPIDFNDLDDGRDRYEPVKSVAKSRLKRLFERQFPSVAKVSAPATVQDKPVVGHELIYKDSPARMGKPWNKDVSEEFEPSSVCLDRMVQNFIEESNERQQLCGPKGCNCINADSVGSSDDDVDSCSCFGDSNHTPSLDACEVLKSLVCCVSVAERNVLADTARIVEKNKISKGKAEFCQKIVTNGLMALGYNASICKSRWEKSSSCPAGEYAYVDVIIEGERLIIDVDFRSEFEIARATKKYKTILQTLPVIFVGKADRLQRIICLVSEAAKQSLKKRGMAFPPWRKTEYVKAKWLSAYARTAPTDKVATELLNPKSSLAVRVTLPNLEKKDSLVPNQPSAIKSELMFDHRSSPVVIADDHVDDVFSMSNGSDKDEMPVVEQQKPPDIKPNKAPGGVNITSGLACIIDDGP